MTHTRGTRMALLIALTCACGPGNGGVEMIELVASDTLVSTASERIGGVYDLAVTPDERVLVADYGFKHVLSIGRSGDARVIGGEGSGPGEFTMPYTVGGTSDSVRVFDAGSNLVQIFDAEGRLARGYALEAPGLGGSRDFAPDGSLAATIGGFDDAMITVLDPGGQRVADIGAPLVPAVRFYDFTAIKEQIGDGRVPDAFKNRALVAWGPDRSLYLAFLTEPEVRRYDADGTLLWTRRIEEPVLTSALERFIRLNRAEQNPARIHSLQYVRDVEAVDGDLWLLLNTAEEEDGLMLVLDADDGSTVMRITFPGLPNTGAFAVDPDRQRLYMAPREEASVIAFELP